jgi:hypothetical protein
MSMAQGNAAMPIRDTVRNFDAFTQSVMTSLYDWNMEFNTDGSIKGDFNVITRGSTSLMAKEVRAQHFMTFAQTIQPEEREHIDWRKNITERMKAMDMVPDETLADEKTVQANREANQKKQQEMEDQQRALLQAEIRNTLSQALKNAAQAKKNSAGADTSIYQSIMAGLDQIAAQEDAQHAKLSDAVKADREHGLATQQADLAGTQADREHQLATQQADQAAEQARQEHERGVVGLAIKHMEAKQKPGLGAKAA